MFKPTYKFRAGQQPKARRLTGAGPTPFHAPTSGSVEPTGTLRRFYDSASVMMGTVELRGDDILHVSDNQATATFFDTTPEAMRGRTARAMGVPEAYLPMWLDAYRKSVHSDGPVRFEYEHEGKGWLKVTVNYIGLSRGRERFLYVVDDVSDLKNSERALQEAHDQLEARVEARTAELEHAKAELEAINNRLRHDAQHDPLTGLPNRLLFTDRLTRALEQFRNDPERGFAVLFLDLDHFKVINDSLGHTAGDALLVAVGERLAGCVREGDLVARFGGDEFTVLLEGCTTERAAEVAARLREAFARPFRVWERLFTFSVSIGVVFAEAEHVHPEELLRDADLAMYRAKAHRSGRYEVFDPRMRVEAVRRLELEADLRAALEGRALEVHYQPVVRLEDGALTGFEALVRWAHPRFGLLTPDAFVPLAEETGLVVKLDRFVLRRACRQFGLWQAEFPELAALSLNVNLSSKQFLHEGLAGAVERALLQSDLSPRQLNLEITESLLLQPAAAVDAVIEELRALGVGLCLDDFGTGYASLSYLRRFPASGLKIDRSFVQDVGESDKGAGLVGGVLTLAETLGLRVVAEGVEDEVQVQALRRLGCGLGQGYLFSRPLSAEQAHAYLAEKLAEEAHGR